VTKGTYAGGTFGGLWGGGVGLYVDSLGRVYPQLYGGTPRLSLSAGYSSDLEGFLTGTSVSGSVGGGSMRLNAGTSGTATGVGIGTPGVGVTYGFGPFEMSRDISRPWTTPYIRDSARAAGVPSRSNVWEYDYPPENPKPTVTSARNGKSYTPQEAANFLSNPLAPTRVDPASAPPSMDPDGMSEDKTRSRVFNTGAPPIHFFPQASQYLPRGFPGWSSVTGTAAPDSVQPHESEKPGGLLGLLIEHARNNPYDY
jgi:hypothetical protein